MQAMAPPEDALTERFARLDERIVNVDRRVAEAAKESNRQFEEVNRRITEGKEETSRRFDRVEEDVKDLKKSFGSVQESVASIQATLTRIGFGLALTFASVLLTRGF
jgi:seryl-tRNA synthetase